MKVYLIKMTKRLEGYCDEYGIPEPDKVSIMLEEGASTSAAAAYEMLYNITERYFNFVLTEYEKYKAKDMGFEKPAMEMVSKDDEVYGIVHDDYTTGGSYVFEIVETELKEELL